MERESHWERRRAIHIHTLILLEIGKKRRTKEEKKKKSLFILAVYSCAPDKRHMMLTKAYILADACSASSQLTSH